MQKNSNIPFDADFDAPLQKQTSQKQIFLFGVGTAFLAFCTIGFWILLWLVLSRY